MKKQIKKLTLNKRTISNLGTPQLNNIIGGAKPTYYCVTIDYRCTQGCGPTVECYPTQKGHTCNGGNNC